MNGYRDKRIVYGMRRPGDTAIRYIGQTKVTLRNRLLAHKRKPVTEALRNWFAELASEGLEPEIFQIAEARDYGHALVVEASWVRSQSFLFGDSLLNVINREDSFIPAKLVERFASITRRKRYFPDWYWRNEC